LPLGTRRIGWCSSETGLSDVRVAPGDRWSAEDTIADVSVGAASATQSSALLRVRESSGYPRIGSIGNAF
jgi:hypothetical protein